MLLVIGVLSVFFLSGFKVSDEILKSAQADENFRVLRDTTDPAGRSETLRKKNPDYFAWIKVPGTRIDYPVMSTPENERYYLYRNFDGENSRWGTPFLAKGCSLDSGNLIIYAHHMKDGSMFENLSKYESRDFFEKHRDVYLSAGTENLHYRVFAVVLTSTEETDFDFYNYVSIKTGEEREAYLKKIKDKAVIMDETDFGGEDFLTLVTCGYHTRNGRIIVISKRD